MKLYSQRGQVLLAVILVAVVALTIGLSLVSRSITSVRVASQSEESQRAFQAAEAGVEQAVNAIKLSPTPPSSLPGGELSNNATYETDITVVQGREILLNGGQDLEQGIGSDVWFAAYPNYSNPMTASIRVYFANTNQTQCSGSGENITPALEMLVLSGTVANPTMSKVVVDPCNRIGGSVSQSGNGGTILGESFAYFYNLTLNNALIARVVPIYNDTPGAITVITSGLSFPAQGSIIESVGKSGESVRRVRVWRSNPQIPIELFQYAILSQ